MTLLLDSDTIMNWLADVVLEEIATHLAANQRAISVISLMEVVEGIRDSDALAVERLSTLAMGTAVYPVTARTAFTAATIRKSLRQRKAPVNHRVLDILIAATAIEHDLILVTRNIRDYQDIEGLRLWTSASS